MYAIILNEPDDEVWARVEALWPRSYIFSNTVAFIAPDDPVSVTGGIAGKVGMNEEEEVLGIVVAVGANDGYNYGSLWEWMNQVSS